MKGFFVEHSPRECAIVRHSDTPGTPEGLRGWQYKNRREWLAFVYVSEHDRWQLLYKAPKKEVTCLAGAAHLATILPEMLKFAREFELLDEGNRAVVKELGRWYETAREEIDRLRR